MSVIQKTITHRIKDRKSALFFYNDHKLQMLILAFVIILGLEVYYKNRYVGGAIYLCGFWSFVFAVRLLGEFLAYNMGRNKMNSISSQQDNTITESISFSEESFGVEVHGVYRIEYIWNSMTRFNETKKYIVVEFIGGEILVAKSYFTPEEVKDIFKLLHSKRDT